MYGFIPNELKFCPQTPLDSCEHSYAKCNTTLFPMAVLVKIPFYGPAFVEATRVHYLCIDWAPEPIGSRNFGRNEQEREIYDQVDLPASHSYSLFKVRSNNCFLVFLFARSCVVIRKPLGATSVRYFIHSPYTYMNHVGVSSMRMYIPQKNTGLQTIMILCMFQWGGGWRGDILPPLPSPSPQMLRTIIIYWSECIWALASTPNSLSNVEREPGTLWCHNLHKHPIKLLGYKIYQATSFLEASWPNLLVQGLISLPALPISTVNEEDPILSYFIA